MRKRFSNPAVVAQGMLAPSGYYQDAVDPVVQSTTRPFGTLLKPSPGYDTIRIGKNRFQGRGPTGGFRWQEFAEDVGGTGAILAVAPGSTSANDATEWLPEGQDSFQEGDMIIADRHRDVTAVSGLASELHEGLATIPDMGDRSAARPLSKSKWLVNPIGMFRADYRESPAITVAATGALICLMTYIARDLERNFGTSRGSGGVTRDAVAVPEAGVHTTTDVAQDGVKKVSDATDQAVDKIGDATEAAVRAIEGAANKTADAVT
jgi:hypothetical protein